MAVFPIHTDEYFSFENLSYYSSSAALGSQWTHLHRAEHAYDSRGRESRTVLADGTIFRVVFDGLGRPVSEWLGENDTPASGSWSPTNPAAEGDPGRPGRRRAALLARD